MMVKTGIQADTIAKLLAFNYSRIWQFQTFWITGIARAETYDHIISDITMKLSLTDDLNRMFSKLERENKYW